VIWRGPSGKTGVWYPNDPYAWLPVYAFGFDADLSKHYREAALRGDRFCFQVVVNGEGVLHHES